MLLFLTGVTVQRFVDRDMLMRHHWGLGVGHTYSHVRDSATDPVESTEERLHAFTEPSSTYMRRDSRISHTPLGGFDDLNNNFSPSDLDWENGDCTALDYDTEDVEPEDTRLGCQNSSPRGFDDLDPSFLLGDQEVLEWEVTPSEESEHDEESDDDSNASTDTYEMYD